MENSKPKIVWRWSHHVEKKRCISNFVLGSEIITEERFLKLEGQYIKDKEAMSKEALLEFKKHVKEEKFTSEFKEERLKRIESILVGRNQANSRREVRETYLTDLAYEYVDLTDNWLKLGATFREWHPFTTWEYQGTDFFQWISGEHSEQILPRARKASDKLKELIKVSTQ